MKQTSYNFGTPVGIAGGLYDLTKYISDSFNNGEDDGVLKHGMGVVTGEKPGVAALPSEGSTIYSFEGVLMNGHITEHTMDGEVTVKNGQTVGVLKQGRIWARVTEDALPAYGKAVLLVITGENAGLFTSADDEDEAANTIAVNAKFLTEKGTDNVAVVEVYPTMVVPSSAAAAVAVAADAGDDNGTEGSGSES